MPTESTQIDPITEILVEVRELRREVLEMRAELFDLRAQHGMAPAVLTIEEAARKLNCSRAQLYRLIGEKRIEFGPKFGRKTTVTTASVLSLLEVAEPEPPKKPKRPPRSSAEFRAELRAAFRDGQERPKKSKRPPRAKADLRAELQSVKW